MQRTTRCTVLLSIDTLIATDGKACTVLVPSSLCLLSAVHYRVPTAQRSTGCGRERSDDKVVSAALEGRSRLCLTKIVNSVNDFQTRTGYATTVKKVVGLDSTYRAGS